MNLETGKIKDSLVNFLVPLISLGGTLLVVFAVIMPSISNYPDLQAQLMARQQLENQLRTKLANLNKLVDFEAIVAEDASILERVLVPEPAVPELLTQIDIVARDSGLVVNRLSYSFGESSGAEEVLPYNTVNVNLGALGNYEQINTFLSNLENSARLVDVSTFRFASETSDDTDGQFNATFVLRSPYLTVESTAVTDDPVNVDVSTPEFIQVLDRIKQFRFYDITADTQFEELEESPAEEVEELPEEEVPEGEVSEDELQELVEETPAETTPTQ